LKTSEYASELNRYVSVTNNYNNIIIIVITRYLFKVGNV